MVQWHPHKRCLSVSGGSYTIFWWKVLPCKFRESSRLVLQHVLATMAGLAASHCVDDVLSVVRKTTKFSGRLVWRVLAACCGWVAPDGTESSSVTGSSHSWCNIRFITGTVWPSNNFTFIRQSRAIDDHGQRHFGFRSLELCNGSQQCGDAWGSAALRCLVGLAG